MSNVVQIPTVSVSPRDAHENARAESIISTIKILFGELSIADQKHLLTQLTEILRPIPAPRAGDVLSAVIHLLPKRPDWTVTELKQAIDRHGVEATPKEVYNALGYLTRKQKIQRVGHGRYMVDGALLETIDDLGVGPPARHEIDDT
jgi:hypothetical protein